MGERLRQNLFSLKPEPLPLHRTYITASRAADTARTNRFRNIGCASIVGSVVAVIAVIFAIGASLIGIQANNSANQSSARESLSNTQVADANSALTAVPPTLSAISTTVAQGEARIEPL